MPTDARRQFVQKRARIDFKANKHLTEPQDITLHLNLGYTQLDTVLLQADHLRTLQQQGLLRY